MKENLKRKLFNRFFSNLDGKEVLRILYDEAYGSAHLEQKDALSYAFEAGKRSMWMFIAANSSMGVDKFLTDMMKEIVDE
jgi:hypothetical protein